MKRPMTIQRQAELYERCFIEEGSQTAKGGTKDSYAYLSGKLYERAGRVDKAINVYLKDSLLLKPRNCMKKGRPCKGR